MLIFCLLFCVLNCQQIFLSENKDDQISIKKNQSFQIQYSPFDNSVFLEYEPVNQLAMTWPLCNISQRQIKLNKLKSLQLSDILQDKFIDKLIIEDFISQEHLYWVLLNNGTFFQIDIDLENKNNIFTIMKQFSPEESYVQSQKKLIRYDSVNKIIIVVYELQEKAYFVQLNNEISQYNTTNTNDLINDDEDEQKVDFFLGIDGFNKINEIQNQNMHQYNLLKSFELKNKLNKLKNIKTQDNLIFICIKDSVEVYKFQNETIKFYQQLKFEYEKDGQKIQLVDLQRVTIDFNSIWILDEYHGLFCYKFGLQQDQIHFFLYRQILVKVFFISQQGANLFSHLHHENILITGYDSNNKNQYFLQEYLYNKTDLSYILNFNYITKLPTTYIRSTYSYSLLLQQNIHTFFYEKLNYELVGKKLNQLNQPDLQFIDVGLKKAIFQRTQINQDQTHKYLIGISDYSIDINFLQYHDAKLFCHGDFEAGQYIYQMKIHTLSCQKSVQANQSHLFSNCIQSNKVIVNLENNKTHLQQSHIIRNLTIIFILSVIIFIIILFLVRRKFQNKLNEAQQRIFRLENVRYSELQTNEQEIFPQN